MGIDTDEEAHTHNSTFAIGGVFPLRRDKLCSVENFVVTENLYLRINICGENPARAQSPGTLCVMLGGSANLKHSARNEQT